MRQNFTDPIGRDIPDDWWTSNAPPVLAGATPPPVTVDAPPAAPGSSPRTYGQIGGFDLGKLQNEGYSSAKYTPAVRTFSAGLGAGTAFGRGNLEPMVAYARANGFPNAKSKGDDSIDFGDGNGPIDMIGAGDNRLQFLNGADRNAPASATGQTMTHQEALDKVQRAIGRPLSKEELQGVYQKFGGDENSQTTDAQLAPVISYLQSQGNLGGDARGRNLGPGPDVSGIPRGEIGGGPGQNERWGNLAPGDTPPQDPRLQRGGVWQPTEANRTNYGDPGQGIYPDIYQSNPNAPGFGNAPGREPDYVAPAWGGGDYKSGMFTAPTQAEIEATPGYQTRMRAGQNVLERSAAAKGSVLSGGTQQALARYGQEYGANEYDAGFGRALTTFGVNEGNAYKDYTTRYGQFSDAANRGLGARQQNVGERNTQFGQQQSTDRNRYGAWLDQNSRTLQDYLTNLSARRNTSNDYWQHLKDLFDAGNNSANNSYRNQVIA